MLSIPKDIPRVPVRRFNGKAENTVCFLPREHFERESSDAYQRLHASKTETSINAHGVAMSDSLTCSEFKYHRGDKFWISIGANQNRHEQDVPVVNLRT
ncbi:hypothetical protein LZ554_005593 [Drepanopeziza brunnea f. sp. 'monogermtubi']|nr:hypothetical protein LZ554_005593 [Drepanopeziza brunnea f. sp. 'monogermtubi']